MKITINVDCTPEEARTFLGLPDVQPMQGRVLEEIESRMMAGLRSMNPDEILKLWVPTGFKTFEQMMESFARMGGAGRRKDPSDP